MGVATFFLYQKNPETSVTSTYDVFPITESIGNNEIDIQTRNVDYTANM